jgi:hypothetical protein
MTRRLEGAMLPTDLPSDLPTAAIAVSAASMCRDEPIDLAATWGGAALPLAAIHVVSAWPSADCSAATMARSAAGTSPRTSTRSSPLQ